jgi:preprotein translocase subunit SecG
MFTVVLVLHLMIICVLIGVVLLQRSEGGALSGLGGGGGLGGLMSGRGAANVLTRTTAILAAAFFATSILLSVLSGAAQKSRSLLDTTPESSGGVAAPAPVAPLPQDSGGSAPTPANPSAPLPQ